MRNVCVFNTQKDDAQSHAHAYAIDIATLCRHMPAHMLRVVDDALTEPRHTIKYAWKMTIFCMQLLVAMVVSGCLG